MHSDRFNWRDGDAVERGLTPRREWPADQGQSLFDKLLTTIAPCPWFDGIGIAEQPKRQPATIKLGIYTPEQRRRRDETPWTTVQGILAPIQFGVFLISLCLVVNYLLSGKGYEIATASVIVKTLLLYSIMITGAIWEKQVFGKYLFAPAFFWEDAVSMIVIALHTTYLAAVIGGWYSTGGMMMLALAAYAAYVVNATQFILKLRAARLQSSGDVSHGRAI